MKTPPIVPTPCAGETPESQRSSPTAGSRLTDLEARKTELLDEKAANVQRLAEINAKLKNTAPRDRGTRENVALLNERSEIVGDNADLDMELREINQKLKAANTQTSGGIGLGYVVTLVAARIASGDCRPVHELAIEAALLLEEIKAALAPENS